MNENLLPENILETERLILREFDFGDAPSILTLVNTSSWLEFIGDKNVQSIQDAENYLETGPMASYRKNGFGLWAALTKDDQTFIGMCGLVNRDSLDDIDIGFALLPEYASMGYAYEMASATIHYAKNKLNLGKVVAITDVNNTSSIKLLNKIGLQFKKTVNLSINDSALLFTQPDTTKDQQDIDTLTTQFFSLFTNKDGALPNVNAIKDIFIPEGIITNNAGENTVINDLDSFISPRKKILTDGTLTEFHEREVTQKTNIFGNIAQRFCLYEKSGKIDGKYFETKGMKTIQFVKVKNDWKMSSVAWSDEVI